MNLALLIYHLLRAIAMSANLNINLKVYKLLFLRKIVKIVKILKILKFKDNKNYK